MQPTFENTNRTVQQLVLAAESGDMIIPSIQRPFVWKPRQIAYFIDSLLRGWPCGTLLTLNKKSGAENLFPTRTFAREINPEKGGKPEYSSQIADLVLDGQQRVQSLYIALGKLSSGYSLSKKEWKDDGCPIENKKIAQGCLVRKRLCFNLKAWNEDLNINFYGNLSEDESMESAWLLWKSEEEMAEDDACVPLSEAFLPDWNEMGPSREYHTAAAWLKKAMAELRELNVPVLDICLESSLETERKEDDIVNMFTRLNTAGTPLTKEQILAARVNQVWDQFPERIRELQVKLSDARNRMDIGEDSIVTGFNVVLVALTGKEKIAEAYSQVRKNGKWEEYWSRFVDAFELIRRALEERHFRYPYEYRSLYVLWFATALFCLQERNQDSQNDREDRVSGEFVDMLVKWLLLANWAKIWANKSGQSVHTYTVKLAQLHGQENICGVNELKHWQEGLKQKACDEIETLMASARGDVRQYYTFLLVWMRMTPERAELLTKFRQDGAFALAVDHIIPASWVKGNHEFNRIGNCWLLDSEANGQKSDEPFENFLEMYHADKDNIAEIIDCSPAHLSWRREHNPESVYNDIREREKTIKQDLKKYVNDDDVELFYNVTQQKFHFDPGFYRGKEFVASSYFLDGTNENSRRSYVSNIRTTVAELNWSRDCGPHPAGSSAETVSADIRDNWNRYRSDVRVKYTSAWKRYIDFLADKPLGLSTGKKTVARRNKAEAIEYADDPYPDLKIGKLAQHVLGPMLVAGCATDEEVEAMQTEGYSRQQFGIQYPLLRGVEAGETRPEHYYARPITIRRKQYWFCCEWFENQSNNDRPYLLHWIQQHQSNNG